MRVSRTVGVECVWGCVVADLPLQGHFQGCLCSASYVFWRCQCDSVLQQFEVVAQLLHSQSFWKTKSPPAFEIQKRPAVAREPSTCSGPDEHTLDRASANCLQAQIKQLDVTHRA